MSISKILSSSSALVKKEQQMEDMFSQQESMAKAMDLAFEILVEEIEGYWDESEPVDAYNVWFWQDVSRENVEEEIAAIAATLL